MPTNKDEFEKWLDDHPVDHQQNQQQSQQWLEDEQLKIHYETSLHLKHQAECFEEQVVPKWDRESTFEIDRTAKAWFGWLNISPSLSMAMSIVAIMMVLFKVELQFDENGILLTFAGDSRTNMTTLVDEKFKQFRRDQHIIMANYVDDIQSQQQQDVTQLASYLVNSSRQERKEEMGELVSFLKLQRTEDISLNELKLRNIVYRMSEANINKDVLHTLYEPNAIKVSNKFSNEEGK
jgi:hypothetical protein